MDTKDNLIDKIIYIQLLAPWYSDEEYEYHPSIIYSATIEDGKEYVYSLYTETNLLCKILKDDIYNIDNEYYVNMPNYKFVGLRKDKDV